MASALIEDPINKIKRPLQAFLIHKDTNALKEIAEGLGNIHFLQKILILSAIQAYLTDNNTKQLNEQAFTNLEIPNVTFQDVKYAPEIRLNTCENGIKHNQFYHFIFDNIVYGQSTHFYLAYSGLSANENHNIWLRDIIKQYTNEGEKLFLSLVIKYDPKLISGLKITHGTDEFFLKKIGEELENIAEKIIDSNINNSKFTNIISQVQKSTQKPVEISDTNNDNIITESEVFIADKNSNVPDADVTPQTQEATEKYDTAENSSPRDETSGIIEESSLLIPGGAVVFNTEEFNKPIEEAGKESWISKYIGCPIM